MRAHDDPDGPCQDADADGFRAASCGGDDCDDARADVHAEATDVPNDGVDQDCQGGDAIDADGDGFASRASGGDDCDDQDPAAHPGAPDSLGDDVDQSCDGIDGEDADRDAQLSVSSGGTDCDDHDPLVFRGAQGFEAEVVDTGVDGDAVALTLGHDGIPRIGYLARGRVRFARRADAGWSTEWLLRGDCSDVDVAVEPDGTELIAFLCGGAVVAERTEDGWERTYVGSGGEVPDGGLALLGDSVTGPAVAWVYSNSVGTDCNDEGCYNWQTTTGVEVATRSDDGEWYPRGAMLDGFTIWGLQADAAGLAHLVTQSFEGLAVASGEPNSIRTWSLSRPLPEQRSDVDIAAQAVGPDDGARILARRGNGQAVLASDACGAWATRSVGEAAGRPALAFGPDGTLHSAWISDTAGLVHTVQRGATEVTRTVDREARGRVDLVVDEQGFAHFAYRVRDQLRHAVGPFRPGRDHDCDGVVTVDADGDGHASVDDGGLDCDDGHARVGPMGVDVAGDGRDTDCDGTDGVDRDGDGRVARRAGGDDCDDADPTTK